MKVIITKKNDNSLILTWAAKELINSNDDYIAIADKAGLSDYYLLDESLIPDDLLFFDAYELNDTNDALVCNRDKAVELKKSQFRTLRAPLLNDLDVAYMRADEQQNEPLKLSIAAKKQLLRDVTTITMPEDIEELREFIPDILKEE